MTTAAKSLPEKGRGVSYFKLYKEERSKSSGGTQLVQTVGTESANAVRGRVIKYATTAVPVPTVNG